MGHVGLLHYCYYDGIKVNLGIKHMRDTILFGDCRDTLKQFDEKARMCVTSPPYYGLRDYGGEA